jgi:carboxyl-terminal processing protease
MRTPVRAAVATAVFTAALFVMMGTSFYAGYVTARVGAAVPLLGTLPMPPGVVLARSRATSLADLRERLGVVAEAWRIVNDEYYDAGALDGAKLSHAAIKGFVEALGDSHTTFADPQRTRQQQDDIRGGFDGIGISVEIRDGRLLIARVIDDSPAQVAGLRVGDAIVRIDGDDVRAPTLDAIVGKIRGPRGTRVSLAISRDAAVPPLQIEVVRGEIKTSRVLSKMLPGQVAYLQLPSFSGSSSRDLTEELKKVMENRPSGLVIDLRNNPGGLLNSAVDVASQFLDEGVVLYEQRREGEVTPFYARRGGIATEVPMAVLVNHGSASASEIVAGALQDRGRAVLVGEATYGKDSVQNVHELSDHSSLRVTAARWFTPLRQPIAGRGLRPDIVVAASEDDRRTGRDTQLDRAADYLRTRLARVG